MLAKSGLSVQINRNCLHLNLKISLLNKDFYTKGGIARFLFTTKEDLAFFKTYQCTVYAFGN